MSIYLRRREFIAVLGGSAAWPLAERARRPTIPRLAGGSGSSPPSRNVLGPRCEHGSE
jgi:hypothetical protein